MFDGMNWYQVTKFDGRAVALYSRHYSSVRNGSTFADWLRSGITPPGESITLMTVDCSALFVWLKQQYIDSDQTGINCTVFRNEGGLLSSALILEAEQIAWGRWPGERLYTYVDGAAVGSSNPGYCFLRAGWSRLKETTGRGLRILEKEPTL
jgi:hypothetical protein